MLAPPNRAHLPPSPWTDEKIAQLKKMYADGVSSTGIGAVLGFSRGAISGKIDRLGITGRARAVALRASKVRGDKDRSATMRIKTLKVRGPSNGGAVVVESLVREPDPEIAEFSTAIPLGQRCTLLELDSEKCHFPIGEVGAPDFFFCGGKTDGAVYCRYHARVCYQLPARPVLRPYLPTGGSKPRVF